LFDMMPGWGWLLLAYIAGTGIGMWWNFKRVIETTIDSLVTQGYLKHRKKADGEIEILKYNED